MKLFHDKKHILAALDAGAKAADLAGENWWNDQAMVKPVVAHALDELVSKFVKSDGENVVVYCNALVGYPELKKCSPRNFVAEESMLDVAIFLGARLKEKRSKDLPRWARELPLLTDPFEALGTAESEAYGRHVVGGDSATSDYLWDFFKLLMVPSRLRLFVARVERVGKQTAEQRRNALADDLKKMVGHYSGALRDRDQLWTIVAFKGAAATNEFLIDGWACVNGEVRGLEK